MNQDTLQIPIHRLTSLIYTVLSEKTYFTKGCIAIDESGQNIRSALGVKSKPDIAKDLK